MVDPATQAALAEAKKLFDTWNAAKVWSDDYDDDAINALYESDAIKYAAVRGIEVLPRADRPRHSTVTPSAPDDHSARSALLSRPGRGRAAPHSTVTLSGSHTHSLLSRAGRALAVAPRSPRTHMAS